MYVVVCALRLYPANPGWGLRCVCLGTVLATPRPSWLQGRVCVWVRGFAAPRQSWLAVGVCELLCVLYLQPAISGWGVRCVRVLTSPDPSWVRLPVCVFAFEFCVHPANSGWSVPVCVFVCALRLYLANPRWGVRCVCLAPGV